MIEFQRLPDENEESFTWRICQAKGNGSLEADWSEIADVINKEFRSDESEYRTEAAYRKPYQQAKRFFESGVFNKYEPSNGVYFDELKAAKADVKKERQKLFDERTEYNRLIRSEARKESFADMVRNIICKEVSPIDITVDGRFVPVCGENDLLCHLTDIHTGIEISNWKNTFNEEVLLRRMEEYTQHILHIRDIHNSENLYIVIGEILSGLIHNNLRLQNNMDLMQQFKYVSELISGMLTTLSEKFNHIYVYTTPGNHSRVVAKKEDALDGENMDVLLPFYLKARLQNFENISIMDNVIEPEIAMFNIRGRTVMAAHGHKDAPASVVQSFTMMFSIKPDIVLLGHRHTNGLSTVFDTKVIQSGCVSGSDEYAVSIRKVNMPEQTVSVVDENGLVCLYDIQLN